MLKNYFYVSVEISNLTICFGELCFWGHNSAVLANRHQLSALVYCGMWEYTLCKVYAVLCPVGVVPVVGGTTPPNIILSRQSREPTSQEK